MSCQFRHIFLLTCRTTKSVSYVKQSSSDRFGLGLSDVSIQKQLKYPPGFSVLSLKDLYCSLRFFSRPNRKPALSFVPLLILIIQRLGT